MGPQDFISAGLAPPDYWRWCAAATGSGTPPRVRIGETCPTENVARLEHWDQRPSWTAQAVPATTGRFLVAVVVG